MGAIPVGAAAYGKLSEHGHWWRSNRGGLGLNKGDPANLSGGSHSQVF